MVKKRDIDKGKGKIVESDDGKSRRPKHEWSNEYVELLIQLLVEEAQVQLGRGGSLVGFQHRWANITEKFNDRREGQDYVDRHQCKNKGDTLKGGWRKWKELTNKQTGLGWSESGNCCTYPEEWVARKAQENRGIHKLVNSKWPSHLVDQMELVWGQSYANGDLRLTLGGIPQQSFDPTDTDTSNVVNTEAQVEAPINTVSENTHYEYTVTGFDGCSMDISAGVGLGSSGGAVGSNDKRVHAPFPGLSGDNSAPIFDLSTAASIGASLTAAAFQGSAFAGIVASGSSNYVPELSLSIEPSDTTAGQLDIPGSAIPNTYYPSFGTDYKPPNWDELMETTADAAVHGRKKKNLQPKKDPQMGKKKSSGSRGKSSAGVEEFDLMKGNLNETMVNCHSMLLGLQAEAEKEDGVISVQDAARVVRGVEGLTRRELTYALMLLASRSHREVLMTMVDVYEIRDWIHHLYASKYGDK